MYREAMHPLDVVRMSLDKTILNGSLLQRFTGFYPRCGTGIALARLAKAEAANEAQREALEKIRALMQRKQDVLTRARRYIRIRTFLECWLYVHVPMTFALLAALLAHIVSVFFFF